MRNKKLFKLGWNDLSLRNFYGQEFEKRQEGLALADNLINRNYLIGLNSAKVLDVPKELGIFSNIRLFRIERFVYDSTENVNDKLISVYGALSELGIEAILMIDSTLSGVSFYIGVRSDKAVNSRTAYADTAAAILKKGIQGNFPGSKLEQLKGQQVETLLSSIKHSNGRNSSKNVSVVSIVPSARDKNKDKFVQGMEKFIDSMMGEEYTAIFIASPLARDVLENTKFSFENLYSALSMLKKQQISFGENDSLAISNSTFNNYTTAINESVSNTNSTFSSYNSSYNSSSSSGGNYGTSSGGSSSGGSYGHTSGSSHGSSTGSSVATAKTFGTSKSEGYGTNYGETSSNGNTRNIGIEFENKTIIDLMQKVDKHLKRMSDSESYGLWECAAYFVSQDVQTAVVAANTYKSLMAGNDSGSENSFINLWSDGDVGTTEILNCLTYCLQPIIQIKGRISYPDQFVTPTCLVSGKDLPLFMGIPRKSVRGMTALEMAPFGRNVFYLSDRKKNSSKIRLGNIFHMGREEGNSEVPLDVKTFASHCFICGSTGSGKSNTSYFLIDRLIEQGKKFLVIEPAKGEYKYAFSNLENINIFCTHPRYFRMLKINPFKFHPQVHVLEHIDRLVEIFNACWPMYAAMPAILKRSIEQTYASCGWDLSNSVHYSNGSNKVFPTFKDLLEILPVVIKTSGYSDETESDYIGSLVTRVRSLTTGIYGQIFCDVFDVDDSKLFDENSIIDLSRIGSVETKALIMGMIILKLSEYRASTAKGSNCDLQHVTIMEEAHNLLKRTSTEQNAEGSNLQGKSVEMISNSIAEMRTYGEGFIIIDQSPTAVDISAIKNTNTKIIMRMPEAEDCEAVGRAAALNERQIKELSKLPTGVAVVFQNDWVESVLCKIDEWNYSKYSCDNQKINQYVCTDKQLRDLRSRALHCFKESIDNHKYNKAFIEKTIDDCAINRHKKEEMKDTLISICSNLNEVLLKDVVRAQAFVTLAGCNDMLNTVPFTAEPVNNTTVNEWLPYIDNYINETVGNKKYKSEIVFSAVLLEQKVTKTYQELYTYLDKAR